MALPKLDLPVYELSLPSTGAKVNFRPFLVKEEKILMMAMESNDESQILRSIKQIINNCSHGDLDVDKLPMFDIEYFFLHLRGKSIGETIEVNVMHPGGVNAKGEACIGQAKLKINIDDVQVERDEELSTTIMLTDTVGMVLRYPTTDDLAKAQKSKGEFDVLLSLMKACIEQVFDAEEVTSRKDIQDKELEDFILGLNTEQFKKISAFFEKLPKVVHRVEWTCPECGEVVKNELKGLGDFFA